MKWLVALVALTAVASIAVATKVVLDNRDPVPSDTLACIRKAGLAPARSSDALTAMRPDALAGTLRVVRHWDWGRTDGALIRGAGGDWTALALWNGDAPSPLTPSGLARVYERPSRFPLVVIAAPDSGELQRCALRN